LNEYKTCDCCKFWDRLSEEESGWCRRYAPRPNDGTEVQLWPIVNPDDWCGEFNPINH